MSLRSVVLGFGLTFATLASVSYATPALPAPDFPSNAGGSAVTIGNVTRTGPFLRLGGQVLKVGPRTANVTVSLNLYRSTSATGTGRLYASRRFVVPRNQSAQAVFLTAACKPSRRVSFWFGTIFANSRNRSGTFTIKAKSVNSVRFRCGA